MSYGGPVIWSEEKVDLLFELRDDEAMDWPEIAREIGYTATQCRNKYYQKECRRRLERGQRPVSDRASNAQIIDRERREQARERASITAQIFGDPPPGYSALDRRRQHA